MGDSGPALERGRVLVTGAAGMLGSQLLLDAPAGFEAVGTDLREPEPAAPGAFLAGVDLTDLDAVRALLTDAGPWDGVLHPAAYTAVDRAEQEPDLARRINADAAENVAAAAREVGAPVVMVSTDFVFDGSATRAYREDDPTSPLGVYGATKLEGEQRALAAHPDGLAVVRTQWLYGPRGKHFPGTMLRLASERDQLRVVDDQRGSPTSTLELSPALWDVLRLGGRGVYHGACEGDCTWHGLAVATLELAGVTGVRVDPCTTADYPTPARRPAYSVLDCTRLAELRGRRFAPWREALSAFLRAEQTVG